MQLSQIVISTNVFLALASHVALVIFFVGYWLKIPAILAVKNFLGRHMLGLALLVSLAGLGGSLFFSEVLGYEPCVLCWIGRIMLYPQILIIALAMYYKDRGEGLKSTMRYLVGLSVLGGLVSLYHSYTQLGGRSFTPCTAEGGTCSILYIMEYGYITIPTMALTAFILILFFVWCGKNAGSGAAERANFSAN